MEGDNPTIYSHNQCNTMSPAKPRTQRAPQIHNISSDSLAEPHDHILAPPTPPSIHTYPSILHPFH